MGRPEALDADQRARLRRLVQSGAPQPRIATLLGVSKGTVSREAARLRARRAA